MIAGAVANHLWQSTIFAALCAIAALALRRNRAAVRHGIWLAASVKFLLPFSLLIAVGSELSWRAAPEAVPARVPEAVVQISQPFPDVALSVRSTLPRQPAPPIALWLVAAGWLGGSLSAVSLWLIRWRRIRAVLRAATPLPIEATRKPTPTFGSAQALSPVRRAAWIS